MWRVKIFRKVFSHGRSCNITSSANSLNTLEVTFVQCVLKLKDVSLTKARRNCCKSFYNNQRIFWNGYASLHTICVTSLSVVFDLQVDVPRTTFFSLPWFLTEECTQQPTPTKSKRHTLTDSEQNVRTLRSFHRSWAQPRNTRPVRLFHRCGKKPLVCAKRPLSHCDSWMRFR